MTTSIESLTPEQQEALAKFNTYLQTRTGGTTNPFLQYIDPESKGGAWSTKAGKSSGAGFGFEGMLDQIGQRLSGKGITAENIGQLGVRTLDEKDEEGNPIQEVYDKTTGKTVSSGQSVDLGGWGEGPGMTYASLTFDEKGKPKISTYGEDTNWFADKGPIMTALKFTPIGPVVAAIDAAQSLYNYGDPTKAILAALPYTGAFDAVAGTAANVAGPAGELASNSGIAGLAQDLGVSADLANKIGRVGAQGILGGTLSTAQGKGFGEGLRSGIASGVIGEGVNQLSAATGLDKGLGSFAAPAKSLVSSALTSAALDKPFDFSSAAMNAAMKFGLGDVVKTAKLDTTQGQALNKFLEFLGGKA